jgi:photosystem II stability/assembly factor-like uncharacterized protein
MRLLGILTGALLLVACSKGLPGDGSVDALTPVDAGDASTASGWSMQASGVTDTLNAVWGSGPNDVYVVGGIGLILHSSDGTSWTRQTSGSAEYLNGVWGSGPNDAVVVGDNGTVLHTTNGGATWAPVTVPATHNLNRVAGASGILFAVGQVGQSGTVLVSVDKGATWTAEAAGDADLYGVWTNGSAAFAVGSNGTILRRQMNAWSPVASGTTELLSQVWSDDATTFFVTGLKGTILRSVDGGTSWSAVGSGTTEALGNVWGPGTGEVYVTGATATLLRSTDTGTTWLPQMSGFTSFVVGIWGSSPTDLFIVGAYGQIAHHT